MIFEFRTYTLHPRTLPEFVKRFGDALERRLTYSKLAAFWYTEIGPLNQVIHVWPYENALERSKIRTQAVKDGVWPPKVSEFIAEMRAEIFEPLAFSPPMSPSNDGPYFEMRSYTLKPGAIPEMAQRWQEHRTENDETAGRSGGILPRLALTEKLTVMLPPGLIVPVAGEAVNQEGSPVYEKLRLAVPKLASE